MKEVKNSSNGSLVRNQEQKQVFHCSEYNIIFCKMLLDGGLDSVAKELLEEYLK